MPHRILALSGSTNTPSKTRALVEKVGALTARRFDATVQTYDLTDLQPSLGQANGLDDLDPVARAIVQGIVTADALIIGSPVYKGSYGGLFKHMFDLIDPTALIGKPVLLVATGGGDKHALVIEHQLRPLFSFFEAATLPTGVYASGADFTDGQPRYPALLNRLDRAVDQFSAWFKRVPESAAA